MGIRATTRGNQFPVVQGALLAQLWCVVVCIPEDVTHRHGQLLQQLGGNDIVGVTGDGAFSGQGEPDAANRDRQRQLPAVPPAMIPGLAPGGFGVNRGMRDFPGQPMFLVTTWKVLAVGGVIDEDSSRRRRKRPGEKADVTDRGGSGNSPSRPGKISPCLL